MKETHPTQAHILRKLLYSAEQRYADLKPEDMEGSQFTFHLDSLINQKLVQKNSDGKYSLTLKGKEVANRFDVDSQVPTRQAKVTALSMCFRNDFKEVLIYTRLKNPFYGCQGFPTGKVKFGESIAEAAVRELKEETQLLGTPELIGIRHYRVYSDETRELLEDKVMYSFRFIDPVGELESNFEGEFKWVPVAEIEKHVPNPMGEFYEKLQMALDFKGQISFMEVEHYTNKF